MKGINRNGELIFPFERVEDNDPLYDTLFNVDYRKGETELREANTEIKDEWLCFKNKGKSNFNSIDEEIKDIDKIYERVIELNNRTRKLDREYALGDKYVLETLMPLFYIQSEIEEYRHNLYFRRDRSKELEIGDYAPANNTPTPASGELQTLPPFLRKIDWCEGKAPDRFYKTLENNKDGLWRYDSLESLLNMKCEITFIGEGQLKHAAFLFKELENKDCIANAKGVKINDRIKESIKFESYNSGDAGLSEKLNREREKLNSEIKTELRRRIIL